MSDECLMKQETVFSFYTQYQAVMRKFTLAGKALVALTIPPSPALAYVSSYSPSGSSRFSARHWGYCPGGYRRSIYRLATLTLLSRYPNAIVLLSTPLTEYPTPSTETAG